MAGNLNISTINNAGFINANLVMNPEFTINQRGAASRTATSSAYNYDRWYYDGTNLLQGIENNNLRNTTYVISWVGSSTCSYSLNTASSSSQGGQSYTSIANGATITISSLGSNNLWLKFNGDLTNLTKVALIEGQTPTGFVSRLQPQELALCQRYLPVLQATTTNQAYICQGYVQTTSQASLFYPFKVTPRVPPTGATINNVTNFGATTVAYGAAATSGYFSNASLDGANFQLTIGSVGYTIGHPLYMYVNGTAGNGQILFNGCEL